jgi:hypothetical protein
LRRADWLFVTDLSVVLLPFQKIRRMILNMEAESFLETSLPNYQSAQRNVSQVRFISYKIICLPFCPIFISCDVKSIQSVT